MSDSPRRWWQWVLMYPTIVIALFAGLPQLYQWGSAVALGLSPFADVGDAQQQEAAWERNVNCLTAINHIKPNSTTLYSIDVVPCPSGDILLTLTPLQNPTQQVSKWVITQALFSETAMSLFSSPAYAQGTGTGTGAPPAASPTAERVVATKTQGSTVIRRVELSNNTCVDQTIDALTGRRLSEQPAPCTPF